VGACNGVPESVSCTVMMGTMLKNNRVVANLQNFPAPGETDLDPGIHDFQDLHVLEPRFNPQNL